MTEEPHSTHHRAAEWGQPGLPEGRAERSSASAWAAAVRAARWGAQQRGGRVGRGRLQKWRRQAAAVVVNCSCHGAGRPALTILTWWSRRHMRHWPNEGHASASRPITAVAHLARLRRPRTPRGVKPSTLRHAAHVGRKHMRSRRCYHRIRRTRKQLSGFRGTARCWIMWGATGVKRERPLIHRPLPRAQLLHVMKFALQGSQRPKMEDFL